MSPRLVEKGPVRNWPLELQIPWKGLEYTGGGKSVARGDRCGGCCSEAVVEAELHDVDPKVSVKVARDSAFTVQHGAVEVNVSMTEVHEVVFELPGPVAPSAVFDARTDHPAGPRAVIVVEGKITIAEG